MLTKVELKAQIVALLDQLIDGDVAPAPVYYRPREALAAHPAIYRDWQHVEMSIRKRRVNGLLDAGIIFELPSISGKRVRLFFDHAKAAVWARNGYKI